MSHTKTIGVLSPILDGFYFGNIIKSISQKAREHNAKVIVIGTSACHYSELYASDYVDGWIVIMDAVDNRYINSLKELGKPIVGINTWLDVDYIVSMNNSEMMDEAVAHLVGHGHQRIAYVGDIYFYDAEKRYEGYLSAMKKNSLSPEPDWFYNIHRQSTLEIAIAMADEGLPYTAVLTVNDLIAIELINHFKDLNIRVPEDIAIMGVDDVPMAKSIRPSLSTFLLPVNDMGFIAAEILIEGWEGRRSFSKINYVSASSVFRESCGCGLRQVAPIVDDPSETIQYLSNMVSRNFNLGLLMQSFNYQETTEMSWLSHTPFQKGFVALQDRDHSAAMMIHSFDLSLVERPKDELTYNSAAEFPPVSKLHDDAFMGEENIIVVVPIVLDADELGALALVGLGDTSTQLYPFNTTYQLANFFASALRRESMNAEMQSYAKQLEIISNITNDGIWEMNAVSKEFYCRGGIYKILGYSAEQLSGDISRVAGLIHPDDLLLAESSMHHHIQTGSPFNLECRVQHSDGDYIWMHLTGHAQFDNYGKLIRLLGSIKDISERKNAEERISQLAYEDTLTGLANRLYFEQHLVECISKAELENTKVAVLLFDLDRFKLINDSYGHHAGDRLLQYVAHKVRSISKKEYIAARMGGDEFVIVMPDIASVDEALAFGAKVVNGWSEPYYDGVREYYISCSIGISLYPDNGSDVETIMKHADIAMYNAKAMGRNRLQLYTSEINDIHVDRLSMENHLRKALKRNELVVYYQPQYSIHTGEIYGLEALVRWNSPKFGFVQPLDFIPLAEETGLIIPIGEWVLREACKINRVREQQGLAALKISVNISARQLTQSDFVPGIRKILEETGADPKKLCLEITESIMLKDVAYSKMILEELLQLGVSLSMDDFGTGYSSLSLLKNLPIQILKIDKSFISDINASVENSAIVQAIITLSHIMSIEVVAEGVETEEQMELLRELQVDCIQGYYISRPMPYEALELSR
ncbi:EAL domain-containing protein [Candidatus Pristimantibacillus sp. PTI5]|uniref:EAL domain-containing protein n=1 Tax=Candidatus Pristimantibacillus sp. PTI5 TaxID=3400422 RepID=UPI003B01CBD2